MVYDFPSPELTRRDLLAGRSDERTFARLPKQLADELRSFANANALSVNRALVELLSLALLAGPQLGTV